MNGSTVHKRWNMNNSELNPYDAFFSKLRNMNPLEKEYSDYQTLLSSGLKTEEALSKMKFSKPPPSGEENYQYLLDIWNHEKMCTFKDFFTLVQEQRRCLNTRSNAKNTCFFSQERNWTCWSSGVHFRFRRRFVSTNLPEPNSIHLLKPIKTCCKRFENKWLVDPLSS